MIINAQKVKDTIEFISKVLEAMKNHAEAHKIDLLYKGFSNELQIYEEKLLDISNKIADAIQSDLIEQYACINRDAIGKYILYNCIIIFFIELKKELDLSELMNNFQKHRFQIDLIQSVRNTSKYPVGNKFNYDKLLIKSKKEIVENREYEYNAKLEKEREIIHRQYRSELDKLTNQVNENTTIIEKQNKEISTYISKK